MLDFFRTASGSLNYVLLVSLGAWFVTTCQLIASGHKHWTDTVSTRMKERQAAEDKVREEQRRSEEAARLAAAEANIEGLKSAPPSESEVPRPPVNPNARLSLMVSNIFLNMNPKGSMFWIVSEKMSPLTAQPVNAAYVKIVNLGSSPVSIDSFNLEELIGGEWQRIRTEQTARASIYMIGTAGLKEAGELDLDGDLIDVNLAKPIQPQQVVTGWMYFRKLTMLNPARFRVIDTLGQEVAATVAPQLDNMIRREGEGSFIKLSGKIRDISGLPRGVLDD